MIFTAIPIVLAIRSIYRKHDELQGIQGYTKAAQMYFDDTKIERTIMKKLNKKK